MDDAQTGAKDANGVRQQGGRLGLVWTPTSKLRIELNGLYQQVDADNLAEAALDATTTRPVVGQLKDDNFVPRPSARASTSCRTGPPTTSASLT